METLRLKIRYEMFFQQRSFQKNQVHRTHTCLNQSSITLFYKRLKVYISYNLSIQYQQSDDNINRYLVKKGTQWYYIPLMFSKNKIIFTIFKTVCQKTNTYYDNVVHLQLEVQMPKDKYFLRNLAYYKLLSQFDDCQKEFPNSQKTIALKISTHQFQV
ncbi:UNKNOWN [Stylonychia lemnae]|uniref:Uncharacterized protein n=1 Tax=Stylonychia lemnae TaxID=5949 RepID=A0A078AMS1_STYLE|nr:UNKNOWN [Stylonychia lemnae]|eukprot:CDW83690.1 UNKNOWN [Stylonychia lemnae]